MRVAKLGLAVLVATGAACGSGSTEPPLDLKCSEPAPDLRADGTWRGQLGGRELSVTLKQACTLVFIYPSWVIGGGWTWGVSSGPANFLHPDLSLKGNPNELTFRGLTISITQAPPYNSVLTGLAEGELPLTASPAGAWQTFSKEPVTLTRQ
jgi:hypothetical protein